MTLVKSLMESIMTGLKGGSTGPGKVNEVSVRVGMLEMHSVAAFRQAFEVQARGTVLEGAKLNLTIMPAVLKCPDCGRETAFGVGEADGHDPIPCKECPGCGKVSGLSGGRGVEGIEVTVEDG